MKHSKYSAYIGLQLIKLRETFGLTQQEAAIHVGVSRSHWSSWENSKRQPSPKQLVTIANIFKIPIEALFIQGAEFKAVKNETTCSPSFTSQTLKNKNFVKTSVYGNIYKLLNQCYLKREVFFIWVDPKIGTTTNLIEYCNDNDFAVYVSGANNFTDIKKKIDFKLNILQPNAQSGLLIIDDVENMESGVLIEILKTFSHTMAIALFSTIYSDCDKIDAFNPQIHIIIYYTEDDIKTIAQNLFPDANDRAICLLLLSTRSSLSDLCNVKKLSNNRHIVTREDVYDLVTELFNTVNLYENYGIVTARDDI